MNLLPKKEKEQLWDMTNAAIRNGVGRNYVFSKLGRYIMKAQLAYFHSEPLSPLVDGLQQSDTDHMLSFFESSQEISYHILWDVSLPDTVGEGIPNGLVSSLRLAGEEGVEINHSKDPDLQVARDMANKT